MKNKDKIIYCVAIIGLIILSNAVVKTYDKNKTTIFKQMQNATVIKVEYRNSDRKVIKTNEYNSYSMFLSDQYLIKTNKPIDEVYIKVTCNPKEVYPNADEIIIEVGKEVISINGVNYIVDWQGGDNQIFRAFTTTAKRCGFDVVYD